MSLATWSFPTTIVFGAGAAESIGTHAKRIGGSRALIVCDPGVRKAGIVDTIKKHLENAGVAVAAFDGVDPNPIEKNVFDGVEAYRAHKADVLVSVGGGSPLAAGKLIALKATHGLPPVDDEQAFSPLNRGSSLRQSSSED